MSVRTVLVCASANPDKLAEMAAILGDAVDLLPRPKGVPDVVEDADTLEGNARLKAVAICEATGRAAVADDTGLEVTALGGAPGVYAARYAGEACSYADNRHKLLSELAGAADRSAQFRTVVVVRRPDGSELVADGICPGTISTEERGERGFGYDAVFIPDEADGRTFAEMSEDEKHAISHRGRAVRDLLRQLIPDT
jgi:XTP/dITP diphosphohydrolase